MCASRFLYLYRLNLLVCFWFFFFIICFIFLHHTTKIPTIKKFHKSFKIYADMCKKMHIIIKESKTTSSSFAMFTDPREIQIQTQFFFESEIHRVCVDCRKKINVRPDESQFLFFRKNKNHKLNKF